MRIVLAGNPNSGKTTLFNSLTGSTAKVGNWPGVTIEKKEGLILGNHDLMLTDLPGIYSLTPYTLEEDIARNVLLSESVDCIINIVDASNIERNLYLTSQLMDLKIPMIIVLNMMDVVTKRGDKIDISKLELQLGHPIIEMVATKHKGIEKIVPLLKQASKRSPSTMVWFDKVVMGAIHNLQSIAHCGEYDAIKVFERDPQFMSKLSTEQLENAERIIEEIESFYQDESKSIVVNQRYEQVDKIVKNIMVKADEKITVTDRIDRIVMHRFLALPIFFIIMALIYYISITSVGDLTIGWVEGLISWIQVQGETLLVGLGASEIIIRLIIDGIIGSIGSIFVFVPQLMILFFFLSLLEDSGYMSRIAFIMDRVFRQIGLSGKSFIPMLIGTGCSIPGVMASRGIENKADREMTILLTPFIPCGAKLPVYAMFLSMMFPKQGWLGPVIYIMPFVVVVIVGYLMKLIRGSGGNLSPFIIELPEYKLPHYHSVLVHMWDKAKEFVKRAGSIIFVAVTILWLLQSFDFQLNYVDDISVSMLAQIGNYLKVIFVPLGFGDFWAASVAALAGTVAKEVVVTTFASIGQTTDIIFTQVSAFSFIIFVSFSAPCVAAMSTMYKELGSLKKTLMAIGFQTGIAYTLSLIFYQTASRIFAGTVAMNPVVLDFGNFEGLPENGIIFSQMGFFIVGLFVLLGAYVLVVNILIKRKLMRGIVS